MNLSCGILNKEGLNENHLFFYSFSYFINGNR